MSQHTEQVEDSSRSTESILGLIEKWYHVPTLAILVGFMAWVRIQTLDNFTRNGEIFFAGNDPWYHLRQVTYTVHHWPRTMPFDTWTYFPYGTSVGQFGTLYDQLVATAALVIGLGNPSDHTIALTLLVAPVVFGSLVAVPTYYLGKQLAGRLPALFGVVLLALLPGTFLRRGLVGFADHNVVEPLFQALAVLGFVVALTVAERERPVYEQFLDRDFAGLRRPIVWSALAGVALATYLWVWPPGALLIGILGVFFLVKIVSDYLRGVSPDHVVVVGAIGLGTAGLLLMVPLGTTSLSPTKFGLLQPLMAFAVAFGSVFLAWLARTWDERSLETTLYPVAVFGLLALGVLVVKLVLPDVFHLFQANLLRFVGFSQGAATRTIGEAQPYLNQAQPQFLVNEFDVVFKDYGLTLFTAGIGAVLMCWRGYSAGETQGKRLLVLVWSALIVSAAFTQVRFNYYLVVPVAVLNAYLFGWVMDAVDLDQLSLARLREVSGYQILAVLLVLLLFVPVLVVPAQIGQAGQQPYMTTTAWKTGTQNSPGAVIQWDDSLQWMKDNTPPEGTYGGADNAMDYNGTYTQGDGDFDYPKGAYGVMSWWDYGHWITVRGERIPDANPFQEGARTAANYLLAPNEQAANGVLDQLDENDAKTRFVMVDWKMVDPQSKFGAPIVFYNQDDLSYYGDFVTQVYNIQGQNARYQFSMLDQRYYESMMVRLYQYHGSAVEPKPIVVDYDTIPGYSGDQYVQTPMDGNVTKRFDTMEAARKFVEEDGSAQIGGIGPYPSERIPALKHYRLVQYSDTSALQNGQYYRSLSQTAGAMPDQAAAQGVLPTNPAWVKVFERVPGATVEGTGPADTVVTASVQMHVPSSGETFVYTQQARTDADGSFTMTLPYSSTGYDQWGPENGYTNVSVRADGPYQFTTPMTAEQEGFVRFNASADVSEAQVIGEDTSAVTVELSKSVIVPDGAKNNSSENASALMLPANVAAHIDA